MTFSYFAYGSNMLPARLSNRCPSAKLIGMGIALDYYLEFSKASKDGSGKATLAAAIGKRLPGVIFEIEDAERAAFDQYEGAGKGYRREENFMVEGMVPNCILVTNTYLATSSNTQLKPYDWYLATVIAGAIYHKLDEAQISSLKGAPAVEDDEMYRESRVAAIKAMRFHGIDDYKTLLENPR